MGEIIPVSAIQEEEEKKLPTIAATQIKEEKLERPSDPLKQFGASLARNFTEIPGLVGLVGSGLETLIRYPFNDKSFGDTFVKAMSGGISKDLIGTSLSLREAGQDLLGIKEAKSTEDQIASLLGMLLVPVPAGFLGGVAAKGVKGALGKASTFLSPAVRMGEKGSRFDRGFKIRAGTQLGVGTALEQGVRALTDNPDFPLIFSQEAITGKGKTTAPPSLTGEEDEEGALSKVLSAFDPISSAQAAEPTAEDFKALEEDTLTGTTVSVGSIVPEEAKAVTTIPLADISEEKPGPIKILEETNRRIEEEQESNLLKNIALTTAGITAVFLGVKFNQKIFAAKNFTVGGLDPVSRSSGFADAANVVKEANVRGGRVEAAKEAKKVVKSKGARLFGSAIDKTKHSETHLRGVGESEDSIKQITGQEIVDPFGVTEQFLKDGKFGQGSATIVRSLKSIKSEFNALDEAGQQEFITGIGFMREDLIRTRATAFDALSKDTEGTLGDLGVAFEKGSIDDLELILKEQEALIEAIRGTKKRTTPGLFNIVEGKKVFIADDVVREGLTAFKANPQYVRMMKDLAKINDAVLDEAVRRGAGDEAWAKGVRQMFTKDGNVLYIPGKENISRAGYFKRLATSMGFHTTTGKQLNGVANWHLQGLVEGKGLQSPLDPFQATANYALQVMEHTNRSVQQWNILSRLTGLRVGADDIGVAVLPKIDDSLEVTRYVGSTSLDDPLNQGGNIHVRFNESDAKIVERFDVRGKGTFTPKQLAEMEDVIWVQRGKAYHGFLVADRQLKKGLEFDAGLHNRVLKFGNFWKNMFTKLTTGELSPFAFTSFIYNNQISSFNALLRASRGEGATIGTATKEAFEVWKDSYKGAWELFSTRMAEDYADILTRSIQQNTALYRSNPDLIRKIRVALKQKVRRTLIAPLQRETGKSASSLGASEFQGNITNIMESAVSHVSRVYGANALPQFWRIWQHLNTAMHEGTALGISMRKSHETVLKNPKASISNISRQARRDANDLVGDVRLRGSSDTAKAFHAVTPFSGAMLQAWSTMGRAMGKAGLGRSMGAVVAAIGIPTALEITYNSALDGEERWPDPSGPDPLTGEHKQWSYREYYWKGYTSEQRTNFHIIMVPGKPPWEAILIPVTPELSLFRGLVIDSMEVIFGLSEHGIEDGNHSLAGLVRMLDFPLNPFLAAMGSSLNMDLRAGIIPDDTEGKGFSFLQGRQLFGTSRVTGSSAQTKYEGGELSVELVGILQNIFGAAGTTMVGVYEAFNAGNEKTSLGTRLNFAMDSLGRNVRRQAKIFQPLFGKSLRPTQDRNVSRDLVSKKNALQQAADNLQTIETGGAMSGGRLSRGDTLSFTADPVGQMLAASAKDFLDQIAPLDEAISELRNQVNKLGNATIDVFQGKALSVKEREDIIDTLNLRIGAYQAQQLSDLKKLEEVFAENIKTQTGKDISGFQFNNYQPGPTPPDLASPGLPKLPQTSR